MNAIAIVARMLLVVVLIQFYAAGLAIFGAASFNFHAATGWIFILLALALTIFSLTSKSRRNSGVLAAIILGMSIAQPVVALGLRNTPWLAALHPVLGLGIAVSLLAMARRAGAAAT
jgi:hypothetical protein